MNQDLRDALESMLDPERNGWAFTERQRDCARILLGMEPKEALAGLGLTTGDLLSDMNPEGWCYDLSKAPFNEKMMVSAYAPHGQTVYIAKRLPNKTWQTAKGFVTTAVYAWAPVVKTAPAPVRGEAYA